MYTKMTYIFHCHCQFLFIKYLQISYSCANINGAYQFIKSTKERCDKFTVYARVNLRHIWLSRLQVNSSQKNVFYVLGHRTKLDVLRYFIWAVRGSDPEKR
jgi:hypothetical protein